MLLNQYDYSLLTTIARYYVLTREQIQHIVSPDHASGRATRKRLTRLRHAGYVQKHAASVAFIDGNGSAPAYYLTRQGAEALAAHFDDDKWLVTNTKHPRADRLAHWIAINDFRRLVENAIAKQSVVKLIDWFTEWQTLNPGASEAERFALHTQLSQEPPLSCSPDAAMLLEMAGHRKVYYIEVDRGTSSPNQIAARKTKGYAALAEIQHHRAHFPSTTLPVFSILFVTTNPSRAREVARAIRKRPRPDLWLFLNRQNLTADNFFFHPVTYDSELIAAPLARSPDSIDSEKSHNPVPLLGID